MPQQQVFLFFKQLTAMGKGAEPGKGEVVKAGGGPHPQKGAGEEDASPRAQRKVLRHFSREGKSNF